VIDQQTKDFINQNDFLLFKEKLFEKKVIYT